MSTNEYLIKSKNGVRVFLNAPGIEHNGSMHSFVDKPFRRGVDATITIFDCTRSVQLDCSWLCQESYEEAIRKVNRLIDGLKETRKLMVARRKAQPDDAA